MPDPKQKKTLPNLGNKNASMGMDGKMTIISAKMKKNYKHMPEIKPVKYKKYSYIDPKTGKDVEKRPAAPQMGHSPAEMSPYKMGHSPNEMGHSPNEMGHSPMENQNKGYAEQERKDLIQDMPIDTRASSIINAGIRSRMGGQPQMGHSPNEMKGSPNHNEKNPKDGKKKNTSGIFGGDTIMGDENKDGNMLSRGLKRLDRALSDPTQRSATRPIVKDGKLNFDLGRMGSVGTGLDK